MEISKDDIRQQSIQCYTQWAEQWRQHAKYHGDRFDHLSLEDFHLSGVGKAALLIANGASFEENIETIKKNQHNVDIVCCDKTLKSCLENGITPKFCVLCDANVSYEKYCEPVKDQLQDTYLIANVCANPKWAANGNWKNSYFFINKDSIESEHEFQAISGCNNIIVAGTNVSNAMVIVLTQCDEKGARNFFGYDKILLIGFDYCWKDKYYSFDHDAGGKVNYMRNVYLKNIGDDFCFSSPNLLFSAKWIIKYIKAYSLPVIQCSKNSIVDGLRVGSLEEQMQYSYNRDDSELMRKLVKIRDKAVEELNKLEDRIKKIAEDHVLAFHRTV